MWTQSPSRIPNVFHYVGCRTLPWSVGLRESLQLSYVLLSFLPRLRSRHHLPRSSFSTVISRVFSRRKTCPSHRGHVSSRRPQVSCTPLSRFVMDPVPSRGPDLPETTHRWSLDNGTTTPVFGFRSPGPYYPLLLQVTHLKHSRSSSNRHFPFPLQDRVPFPTSLLSFSTKQNKTNLTSYKVVQISDFSFF